MTAYTLAQTKKIISKIESDKLSKRFVKQDKGASLVYRDISKNCFHKFVDMEDRFKNETTALNFLTPLGIHGPAYFKEIFFGMLSPTPAFFDKKRRAYTAQGLITTAEVKGYRYEDIEENRRIDSITRNKWLDKIRATVFVDRVILYDFDRDNSDNSLFDIKNEQVNQYDFNNAEVIQTDKDYSFFSEISWRQCVKQKDTNRLLVKNILDERGNMLEKNKKALQPASYHMLSSRIKENMEFVKVSPLFKDEMLSP